jgi:hypothetical protein
MKVVGGSEIYNFPIHHFVYFYSRFLRKNGSNKGSPQRRRQSTSMRAPRRAGAAPPRTSAAPRHPSRPRAFPRCSPFPRTHRPEGPAPRGLAPRAAGYCARGTVPATPYPPVPHRPAGGEGLATFKRLPLLVTHSSILHLALAKTERRFCCPVSSAGVQTGQPRRAPIPWPTTSQSGPFSTSPAPTIARCPVLESSRAPTSPDRQPRRPPPPAAGVPALRQLLAHNRAPKPNPSRP